MIQNGTPLEPVFRIFGRVTVCELVKDGVVLGVGAAIRHPDDYHDPKVGRMVALHRALSECTEQAKQAAKLIVRRNSGHR